jgi:hypothetical protein
VITDVLLRWLMAYLGLLAAVGFGLYVARGAWRRDWSNRTLLRASSLVAFVVATVFWLVLALAE